VVILLAFLAAGGILCPMLSAQTVTLARPMIGSGSSSPAVNGQALSDAATSQGTFETPTLLEKDRQFVLEFCDACVRAADNYREEDRTAAIAEARQLLKTNVKELYYRLSHHNDRTNAEGWIRYLRLQDLQRMLISDNDDFDLLGRAYERFTSLDADPSIPYFVQTRDALKSYLNINDAPNHIEERRELFTRTVNDVCRDIARLLDKNDPALTEYFNDSMAYLLEQQPKSQALLQAKELLDKRFPAPNIQIDISGKLLTAGGSTTFHEPTQISEVIRGTNTRGNGIVDGVAYPVLVENPNQAEINLVFDATLRSNSVGVNQGVTVYSTSTGRVKANKPILISGSLVAKPARVSGAMDAKITGINSGRGPLGSQVVQQRVSEEFPYSKAESQRRMEIRFAERIDSQVNSLLTERTELADALNKINQIVPTTFTSSSTTDNLYLRAKVAYHDQVGPIFDPPEAAAGDVTTKFHESVVNNVAFRTLAGGTFTEDEFSRWFAARFPKLAPALSKPQADSAEENERVTLTFANSTPVLLSLDNDTLTLAIHLDAIALGDKQFPAMDIDVIYALEKRGSQCVLVKKQVEAWPAGLDRDAMVPARYQVVRNQILRRLGENLKDEFSLEAIDLPAFSPKTEDPAAQREFSGRLVPTDLTFRSGWAVCAM
ncbi:MAG: hypothetical protein J6S27_02670, partial [Thermoguttaceae bacterium]|nr:hypothetical protein [Thermoguttaceae bacterium]